MILGRAFPINHNAKANLVGMGEGVGHCQCGGIGVIVATHVISGPYDHQPLTGKGRAAIYGNDGWYIAESETIPCPVCTGNKEEIAHFLLEESNVPIGNRAKTLDYYDDKPGAEDMAMAMQRVIDNLPTCHGFITLFGNHSTGKTTAAQIAVVHACREGINARYISAKDIVTNIKATWRSDTTNEREYIDSLSMPRMLVIDEINSVTGRDLDYIRTILNNRHQIIDEAMTIMIINGNLCADEYIDARTKAGVRIPVT